jgi:hypothetical protein
MTAELMEASICQTKKTAGDISNVIIGKNIKNMNRLILKSENIANKPMADIVQWMIISIISVVFAKG